MKQQALRMRHSCFLT